MGDIMLTSGFNFEGYEIVENTNGTYGVEKSAVAKIGDVEYKYLQAAIDAAQNDATIMMIADVTVAEEVIIDNTEKICFITFILNFLSLFNHT